MKYLLIVFGILLIAFSCSSQSKMLNRKCEKQLIKEIEKNWYYNSNGDYYDVDKKFLNDLDSGYFNCIYGKDTAYISKLFGEHNETTIYVSVEARKDSLFLAIQYNLNPCPNTARSAHCEYYHFYYDKKGIIRKSGKFQANIGWIE